MVAQPIAPLSQGSDLASLASALEGLELGPSLSAASHERDSIVRLIRGYLLPRVVDPTQPLKVVFAGPTGSGKSTLVNSLAGRVVSNTGAVRPTTTGAVALVKEGGPEHEVVLGDMSVATVTGSAPILDAMTLVDSPDIDSTALDHRVKAEVLVDNADIVVFVTSVLRYADEVPWQVLRRADSRGAEIIHVLNRVGVNSKGAIVDFRAKLTAAGFDDTLVSIPEHHIAEEAERVPSLAVRSLARRLVSTALSREQMRDVIWERASSFAVRRSSQLVDAIEDSELTVESLEAELDISLGKQVRRVEWPKDVTVTFPHDGRRGSIRRWRKTAADAVNEHHLNLLVAVLHDDLLSWAKGAAPDGPEAKEVDLVVDSALPSLRLMVVEWRDHLPAIVEFNPFDRWAEAARDDLLVRAEVAYRQVRDGLTEIVASRFSHSDLSPVKAAIPAATLVDA